MKAIVMTRKECLKIAKVLNPKNNDEESLLFSLPEDCFGKVYEVAAIDWHFVLNDGCYTWCVPPYFINHFE